MNHLFQHTDMGRSAMLSDCGRYRYRLTRTWRPEGRKLGWIMLNPSTADAIADDPTIRRCMGFARAWDFGGIEVANLFHLRATDPADLTPPDLSRDPLAASEAIRAHAVGPHDDSYGAVFGCDLIVVAWGSHPIVPRLARDIHIRATATHARKALHCLATNADGQPRHPLYVKGDTKPVAWFQPDAAEGQQGSGQ